MEEVRRVLLAVYPRWISVTELGMMVAILRQNPLMAPGKTMPGERWGRSEAGDRWGRALRRLYGDGRADRIGSRFLLHGSVKGPRTRGNVIITPPPRYRLVLDAEDLL
jgi:hypothetical protein